MQFMYARDALKYLIKKYHIENIYIPYYLCDVIRHAVFEAGAKPIFYHIDDSFFPTEEFPADAYILYPNYFGVCDKQVDRLYKKYPKLIVDNAHAYYSEHKGFASFNSARKFLPVENGAELFLKKGKKKTPLDYKRRAKFIYYDSLFQDNELSFDLQAESIPFCYPYLASCIETADKLVKKLTEQGLTIYRYWNPLPKTFNEYKFYSRLVPIPLDAPKIERLAPSHCEEQQSI